jgi:hypothetical protein
MARSLTSNCRLSNPESKANRQLTPRRPHNSCCRFRPHWGDAVEKVFSGRWTEFSSAAGASDTHQGEGSHRIIRKRPQSFVYVLPGFAGAEAAKNRFSRDFVNYSIFDDFFDSIGHQEPRGAAASAAA